MPNTPGDASPMQNADVAAQFDEIADCLEIAGDNPFKIRAYRRASEAVRDYPQPIESAADAGTLREIDGLGEATAAKVEEFLATGQMRYLELLREEYPLSLLELLRVPGLGPKRVRVLRDQGVINLDQLKAALQAGTLKMGKGFFTPKTIEDIKKGLERLAQVSTRLPLPKARRVGYELAEALRAASGARVEVAGSLRRACDTVGDINLVASVEEVAPVLQAFASLPGLSFEAQDPGTQTATARADGAGVQVRLSCAVPAQFGAVWLQATGSEAHLAELRERAQTVGLEWRAEGLFRGEEPLAAAEESDLYAALKAEFVPPELREGRGEWQAALAGKLPHLLTLDDLRGDIHTHSTWSDGAVSIRAMASAMVTRGYEYFCVTDHSKALAMANGLNAERVRAQAEEIAQVQADFPNLRILRGIECDILRDGTMDLDDETLHDLDFVIGSVHSGFNLDEATQTARIIKAIENPVVDMIGHPTGRILGGRPPYAVNVPALIEAAQATGTALEINSSERLDLKDEYAYLAREAGVLLCINTDAHSLRMLDNIHLGVSTARRAWCEAANVLNTKSLPDLLAWLQR